MATYTAEVEWVLRAGEDFRAGRYSRGHTLRFDGGLSVPPRPRRMSSANGR